MGKVKLDKAQNTALTAMNSLPQYKAMMMNGAGGTGKSLVISQYLKSHASLDDVVVTSMQHSAVMSLRQSINDIAPVQTLMSKLEFSRRNGTNSFMPTVEPSKFKSLLGKTLIIDEASTISRDVQSYLNKLLKLEKVERIIYVGDMAQIPAVKSKNFKPPKTIVTLKTPHRSGKYLKGYATQLRQGFDEKTMTWKTNKGLTPPNNSKVFKSRKKAIKYVHDKYGKNYLIAVYRNDAIDIWRGYTGEDEGDSRVIELRDGIYRSTNGEYIKLNKGAICEVLRERKNVCRIPSSLGAKVVRSIKKRTREIEILADGYKPFTLRVWKEREDRDAIHETRYQYLYDDLKARLDKKSKTKQRLYDSEYQRLCKEDERRNAYNNSRNEFLAFRRPLLMGERELSVIASKYWELKGFFDTIPNIGSTKCFTSNRLQGRTTDCLIYDEAELKHHHSKKHHKYVSLSRARKEVIIYREKGNK